VSGQKAKISPTAALKALRKSKRRGSPLADVVFVARGSLDQEGGWSIEWEAAHWLPELSEQDIAPSGLPAGFATAAAQEIGSVAANDAAEKGFGRLGAALGKGAIDAIMGHLNKDQKE